MKLLSASDCVPDLTALRLCDSGRGLFPWEIQVKAGIRRAHEEAWVALHAENQHIWQLQRVSSLHDIPRRPEHPGV